MAFEPKSSEAIAPSTRLRLDTLYTGGTGLCLLDTITADALGVQTLVEGLRVGDRSIVNRSLGMEVARLASLGDGRYLRRKRHQWLETLERSTRASGTAFDEAGYHRAVGSAAFFLAQWREAYEHCDRASAIWRDRCRGAAWEIATVDAFAITALVHLGELDVLDRRLSAVLADADARGDVYTATSLRMGWPNVHWLAQDRPDQARALADDAVRAWPADRFLVQHYLHLVASVQCDLYTGDVWRAWRTLCDGWPRLKAAFILSVAVTRVDLLNLRARVALAAASSTADARPAGAAAPDPAWSRERLRAHARADASRIRRHGLPTAAPFADAIEAALASDVGTAASRYRRAAAGFDAAGMGLWKAAAEAHVAGPAGEVATSPDALAPPARLLRTLCP